MYSFVNPIVPVTIVNVTALDANPAVGKLFPMKCTVTVAKGITNGSVNITWIVNDTVVRDNKYNFTDSTEYVSWYNITLQPKHNNTVYYCNATINTRLKEVDGFGYIKIDSISLGKYLITMHIAMYNQIAAIIFMSS